MKKVCVPFIFRYAYMDPTELGGIMFEFVEKAAGQYSLTKVIWYRVSYIPLLRNLEPQGSDSTFPIVTTLNNVQHLAWNEKAWLAGHRHPPRRLNAQTRHTGYRKVESDPKVFWSTAIDHALSSGLPSHIASDLDAIRAVGNFAAHPQKAAATGEILPVEPEEAEWNLDVLEALFDYYYVQPAMSEKKRTDLNKKLEAAGKKPIKQPGSAGSPDQQVV